MPPFLIDANQITEFQTCRRKFLLSRQWRSVRWVPVILFQSCLRWGLFRLSNGDKVDEVAIEATTKFMNLAASPGLDIQGGDPYTVAMDYCAMLETILQAHSRRTLTRLSDLPSVAIDDGVEWSFISHKGDDGYLHRWITVDRLDADRISQEAHSWKCFGDIAAAKTPMKLHVIEIGQMRDGRRHSPWARAWQHGVIKGGRIKFTRKGGKALQGDIWKAVYLSDSDAWNSRAWVDIMEEEGMLRTLIHEVELTVPEPHHLKEFRRHVCTEAQQMQQWIDSIPNPRVVPMSRGACDTPYACQFQSVCFSPLVDVDIASLGIYKPRIGFSQIETK